MFNDLKYLKVDLPEDVLKLKCNGNFDEALRLIDLRLEKEIPISLRKRLEIEKEIIRVLRNEYPYSFDEALELMKSNLTSFTKEELIKAKDESEADWILVDGKVMFSDSFYGNLVLTKEELKQRVINKKESEGLRIEYLNKNIENMKKKGQASYFIHMKVTIKIKEEYQKIGEKIKIHIPLPTDDCQQSNVKIISTSPQATYIAPSNYPQRTVYFEEILKKDQEFCVEYSYESHVPYAELDPKKVSEIQLSFHTEEKEPHIMFTPYIKELCEEIVGDEKNPLLKARKIYDFITTKVKYSYMRKYSTILNIPEYAALNLKGDCGVQGLLFITLLRCAGIAAKWQSGLAVTPYHVGAHDWAQFYIEPYGWLYADPSFGGSGYRSGNLEKWNFYFGNLDPFRMVANSEFQHQFDPPKNHWRDDPYDNQLGECEYDDRGLEKKEFLTKLELLEIKEI